MFTEAYFFRVVHLQDLETEVISIVIEVVVRTLTMSVDARTVWHTDRTLVRSSTTRSNDASDA